jgi:NADH dehydrogenase
VALSGFPAAVVTRAYHLLSLPGNRTRIAADWALNTFLSRPTVQLGLVRAAAVPLDSDGSGDAPARRTA